MTRTLLWLALAVFSAPDIEALPPNTPVPGGVAVIELPPSAASAPSASYLGRPVLIQEEQGSHYAVVGIPLSAMPGTHELIIGSSDRLRFQIQPKDYEVQRLTIKDNRRVNPEPTDLERINRERAEMDQVFASFTADQPTVTTFRLPAQGPTSSSFGLRRILNGQPRSPHSGLDIAATEGSEIIAPSEGRVAAVGDYFFNGNTVLIDHGHGLITMYCHMSRIDVSAGDIVRGGDRLGLVGQTGRVTGPHLHWSVSLNDARVDPSIFFTGTHTDPVSQ